MTIFASEPYFILDPNVDVYDEGEKLIPINALAEEAYGKPFDSLRACQMDNENLSNDQVAEYCLADDFVYEDYLGNFDSTEIYLGFDRATMKSAVKTGMTMVEYWKTITWLPEGSSSEATVSPEDVALWRAMEENDPALLASIPYQLERKRRYEAGELTLVEVNPPETKDLEGAVFQDKFFAQRAYSPSLGAVLADLIRRNVLPRGNYIYRHSW